MSEEILKALMQLFAIIAKQDDGVTDAKLEYVDVFLRSQLSADLVDEYSELFKKHAFKESKRSGDKLTSVGDSVRTLGICKKINKTLTQKQKVVVLVRLFELINSDRNFSEQRMEIIDTVSKVFKIKGEEYTSIEDFVKQEERFDNPNFLIISDNQDQIGESSKFIRSEDLAEPIVLLRVDSVNLYFLKYIGQKEVLLNGLTAAANRVYLFANGGSIKPPHGKTIYYSDVALSFLSDTTDVKLSFHAKNVEYKFKNGNVGLQDISVSEGPGTLVGIMGASGAGKTTLLSVLSGLERPTRGQIEINDVDLHKNPEQLKGVIGLVPQDDLLIEELTVYQNLYYNAKLCFKNSSEEETATLANKVLDALGLAQIKDLKVGNPLEKTISGGQRKRLNIGLELIREPAVLFLDEPTSGLSSKDSENVMELLRELTLKGKLVFVVIHQPSSEIYKSFDTIYFLDTGGYMIYNGNPIEAVVYFKTIDQQVNSDIGECATCGNVNPELIFNIVEAKVVDEFGQLTGNRKVKPDTWNGYYNERIPLTEVETTTEKAPGNLDIPSKIKQFFIFTQRDFLSKITNKQYILLNLLEVPVLAFFLSYIIRYIKHPDKTDYIFRDNENLPAFILMCIVVSLFIGLTVSAEEIFKDRKILKRESFLNLSRLSYLFSKIAILFTLSAVQSALLIVIGNSIIGIHDMYFSYWLMLFSVSCFANVLGLNISASFNSAVTIYILIPLLIIPQMVLAGAMFSYDKLNKSIGGGYHVPTIAEFIPARWAYEGIIVNQFHRNDYERNFYDFNKAESDFDFKQAHLVPEMLSLLLFCEENLSNTEEKEQMGTNLQIVKNELAAEYAIDSAIAHPELLSLTTDSLSYESIEKLRQSTREIGKRYAARYNAVASERKKHQNKLEETLGGEENFKKFKNEFHNDYLEQLVRNKLVDDAFIIQNNRIVQVVDPIFHTPEPSFTSINAPFYSPYKYLMGKKMDTFAYNLIILWVMTVLSFIALYFNFLSKLLNTVDGVKSIINKGKKN